MVGYTWWNFFFQKNFGTPLQIVRLGKKIICTKFEINRTTLWGGASHLKIQNFRNFVLFGYYILLYAVKLKQRIKRSMAMWLINIILWNSATTFVIQSLWKHIQQLKRKNQVNWILWRIAYLLGVQIYLCHITVIKVKKMLLYIYIYKEGIYHFHRSK